MPQATHRIIIYLLPLSLLSCSPGNQRPTPSNKSANDPTAHDIAISYTTLKQITKEPVLVNPEFAMMCAGVTQSQIAETRKTFGPHTDTSVSIFMNDSAATTFQRSATPYPVGSIIVKQKIHIYDLPSSNPADPTKDHIGVGGMIKRSPGYDPQHGDWEYFYFEEPTKIESGKIISCVQCHTGAVRTDHVFGTWAKKD